MELLQLSHRDAHEFNTMQFVKCNKINWSNICMILSTQSQAVQTAAYECQWYQHSKMMKPYVLMIMARSQKAVQLTAYQFYVISLETFSKVQYLITLLLNTKIYSTCRTLSTDMRIVLRLSKLAHTEMLLTCIWEVPSSHLGWDTTIMRLNKVFLSPCRQMTEGCCKFGHNCFLPHPNHSLIILPANATAGATDSTIQQ